MTRALLILDGAAGEPIPELDERTALQVATTPALDELAQTGRIGTLFTLPEGVPPRQETGLLNLLGADLSDARSSRAALEAHAIGLQAGPNDLLLAASLVTVFEGTLTDPTAGLITDREAHVLFTALGTHFADRGVRFHELGHHRALFTWHDAGPIPRLRTTPPEDVVGLPTRRCIPAGWGSKPLRQLQREADEILAKHDINLVRGDLGESPASGLWLWGEARIPQLTARGAPIRRMFISASQVACGAAAALGWDVTACEHDDATYVDALRESAFDAQAEYELIAIHCESPLRYSLTGRCDRKIDALARLDGELVGPLVEQLRKTRAWRCMVASAVGASCLQRRLLDDAVIVCLAGTDIESNRGDAFDEENAESGELAFDRGSDALDYLLHH